MQKLNIEQIVQASISLYANNWLRWDFMEIFLFGIY